MSKTGHAVDVESLNILQQESGYLNRKIKEALQIKNIKPSLNRDGGYEISKVYNLIST